MKESQKKNTWYTDYNAVHYRDSNGKCLEIRHCHADLKGSFSCLGVWYNVLNEASMQVCYEMLRDASASDRKTGLEEIEKAKEEVKNWKPKPHMIWFYEEYEKQCKNL